VAVPEDGFLEDEDRGSLVPFGAAVVVFALVVVGVAVFTLTRGDVLTEEQRVGRAVVGQNDALQRQNYADYQRYTCAAAQGTERTCLVHNRNPSGNTVPAMWTT
jgi:hypothetical protein